ncbi:hypothetical protein CRYUN_Cryun02cG0007300 [Craigia yunnanensis]
MDSITSAVEKLKGFAQDLVKYREPSSRRNPCDIHLDSSQHKTSKGNPLEQSNTLLRGEVDLLGAVLLMSKVDVEHWDGVGPAGIRTGVDSRFSFETTLRDRDSVGLSLWLIRKGSQVMVVMNMELHFRCLSCFITQMLVNGFLLSQFQLELSLEIWMLPQTFPFRYNPLDLGLHNRR